MRFLYMVFFTSILFCGDVTVNVDSNQINEGDSITLTVQSRNLEDAPVVNLPTLTDFTIVSGPNQSSNSNYSIIKTPRSFLQTIDPSTDFHEKSPPSCQPAPLQGEGGLQPRHFPS